MNESHLRFTFGSLNPNDVAALLVSLIFTVPVLIAYSRRFVWPVLITEIALVTLLIGTASRGALFGLGCGLVLLGVYFYKQLFSADIRPIIIRFLGAIAVGCVIGVMLFPQTHRLTTIDLASNASSGRRLQVWSEVPAMLGTAPWGWGWGKSADSYQQWFQPIEEEVTLRHLLSSHFNFLTETGLLLRAGWILLWVAGGLLLCNRVAWYWGLGLSLWIAYAVMLLFNASGTWWNWILPTAWLVAALALRWKSRQWPWVPAWGIAAIGSMALAVVISFAVRPSTVSYDGHAVVLGHGQPQWILLGPNKQVLGDFYGHDIRGWLGKESTQTLSTCAVADKPWTGLSTFAQGSRLVVLVGVDAEQVRSWESSLHPQKGMTLLLLNCRIPPDDWTQEFAKVVYCRGEFYPDPYFGEWMNLEHTDTQHVKVKVVRASKTYLADWLGVVCEYGQ